MTVLCWSRFNERSTEYCNNHKFGSCRIDRAGYSSVILWRIILIEFCILPCTFIITKKEIKRTSFPKQCVTKSCSSNKTITNLLQFGYLTFGTISNSHHNFRLFFVLHKHWTYAPMTSKQMLSSKFLITKIAQMRFLPSVDSHVNVQSRFLCESLSANDTNVRSFFSMDSFVVDQSFTPSERFAAKTALVRPLPSVRSSMIN